MNRRMLSAALLTLLQSTQLFTWGPGGLMPTAYRGATSMGSSSKLGEANIKLLSPCLVVQPCIAQLHMQGTR